MSLDAAPPMVPLSADEELNQEASLHASLDRLQEMHLALRGLRDTIPRVVTSLQIAEITPDPAELYAQFSYAATTAGKDIKDFMLMMGDTRAKDLFEQINKSREEDREGIGGWRVTEHEDWLDTKVELKGEMFNDEDGKEQGSGFSAGDREKIVEAFKMVHPSIEVALGDVITAKLPSPINLNVSIDSTNDPNRPKDLNATTTTDDSGSEMIWKVSGVTDSSMKESKFTKSILGAMTTKVHRFTDLGTVLEFVASYSDVTTRPCTKCSRTIDRNGQLALVRKKKPPIRQAAGQRTTEWAAFHESCT